MFSPNGGLTFVNFSRFTVKYASCLNALLSVKQQNSSPDAPLVFHTATEAAVKKSTAQKSGADSLTAAAISLFISSRSRSSALSGSAPSGAAFAQPSEICESRSPDLSSRNSVPCVKILPSIGDPLRNTFGRYA